MATAEQFGAMLKEVMANPTYLQQLKETLGVGTSHEKDKNRVLLDDYTFRRIDK